LHALPEGLPDLAADAAADAVRLVEVLREDWEAGRVTFDAPGEALFGAFKGAALLGLCGLTGDPYLRQDNVGRVRRLYVLRAARRVGVGAALVSAVEKAGSTAGLMRLRVRSPASAFGFYARLGFLRVVGEPAATHVKLLVSGSPPGIP
jgi:GNAT superfamily N-acetyltransferase